MIAIQGPPAHACDGVSRREWLRIGALSALGVSLPSTTQAAQSNTPGFGRAKSCILIYLFGGPSQLDTFDLKPNAPSGFRGEFKPIPTSVPGTHVCEHLPKLAQRAHKFSLIRSMTHEHPRHGWGLYYMLTGRKHSRPDLDAPPTPDDFPGYGAIVNRLGPRPNGGPSAITLPRWNRFNDLPNDYAGERGGFLGEGYSPWLVKATSDDPTQFLMPGLDLHTDAAFNRLDGRREWLAQVDRRIAGWGELGQTHDRLRSQAYNLVTSPAARNAFRLEDEPTSLRDNYGRHAFGQGLLLARRLVQVGTTFVQVNWHNDGSDVKSPFWDTHKDNFKSLKDRLLPPLDVSLSALLDDLDSRGMLESTLVVVMGEFGRTPRIGRVVMNAATNATGRDHWPHAYTVLLAGGGTKPGFVLGASDDHAAFVDHSPVSPPDLQATVLHLLGIPPDARLTDRRGRSHPATLGTPVTELFV
jgi:hypothetical protein